MISKQKINLMKQLNSQYSQTGISKKGYLYISIIDKDLKAEINFTNSLLDLNLLNTLIGYKEIYKHQNYIKELKTLNNILEELGHYHNGKHIYYSKNLMNHLNLLGWNNRMTRIRKKKYYAK